MINPFMLILLVALILPPAVTAIKILTKKKAVNLPPPTDDAPIQPE